MFKRLRLIEIGILAVTVGAATFFGTGSFGAAAGTAVLATLIGLFSRWRLGVLLGKSTTGRSFTYQRVVPQVSVPIPQMSVPQTPASDEVPASQQLPGSQERWIRALRVLPGQLPDDPLDHPDILDISRLYLYETSPELEQLLEKYRVIKSRYLQWRDDAGKLSRQLVRGASDGLGGRTFQSSVQYLNDELTGIEQFLGDLRERANVARRLPDQVVQTCTQVESLVTAVQVELGAAGSTIVLPGAADQLFRAEQRLREARDAMESGRDRPLTAMRLVTEARELAEAAQVAVTRRGELPRVLTRRLEGFSPAAQRVERLISESKAAFQAAAGEYAPANWVELRGVGAAAERAMQRATELSKSAVHKIQSATTLDALDEAAKEVDEAFRSLEEAASLSESILAHIRAVEAAAAGARDAIAVAEAEIDRAWGSVQTTAAPEHLVRRREELLKRASELAAQARAELAREQPDWLSVVALAQRGKDLATQAGAELPTGGEVVTEQRALLSMERARAKLARDQLQALALAAPRQLKPGTRALVDQAERTYQHALSLEAARAERNDHIDDSFALQSLAEVYRSVEQLANTASGQVRSDMERTVMEENVAGAIVWGAMGAIAAGILTGGNN